ncbi:MAG: hypothetical protein H7138_04830 [Myxococcales bacterium]|nr:hypothetical protein [Myxococcales bacterium]
MNITSTWLTGALVALAACGATAPEEPSGTDPAPGETDDSWEAFRLAAVEIEGGPEPHYVYGGDMVAVGEAGLRQAYARYFGVGTKPAPGEGVATSSLSILNDLGADILLEKRYSDSLGGRHELTYCIRSVSFSDTELAALVPALEAATASWTGLVNVGFRHDASQDANCTSNNTNVFFNVVNESGNDFFGLAFWPDDRRGSRQLRIYDAAFTTNANGRDLEGILRHETGHILGFRHEHIWIGCQGSDTDDSRLVTAYDVNSVMHYPQCRPSMSGGYRQTQLDYQGAIELYGMSSALTLAVL